MFRYKQSSLCALRGTGVWYETEYGVLYWNSIQVLENEVALMVASWCVGGSGGWKRRFPTGGAAYGIPRKASTPGDGENPWIVPDVVLIVCFAWARREKARAKKSGRIVVVFVCGCQYCPLLYIEVEF